jgi:hypothetical protein
LLQNSQGRCPGAVQGAAYSPGDGGKTSNLGRSFDDAGEKEQFNAAVYSCSYRVKRGNIRALNPGSSTFAAASRVKAAKLRASNPKSQGKSPGSSL